MDNVNVGKDLAEVYWKPGNRSQFLDLVQTLTGSPLSAEAWVQRLQTPVEVVLKTESEAYELAVKTGPTYAPGSDVDLDMRVLLVHGDEVIADSAGEGGLSRACGVYKQWLSTLK